MSIQKRGVNFNISYESLQRWNGTADSFEFVLGHYPRRKVDYVETIPVTDEQRAKHARATELFQELSQNEYFVDEGSGISRLEPKKVTHYAETHDEWVQRCRKIKQEDQAGTPRGVPCED